MRETRTRHSRDKGAHSGPCSRCRSQRHLNRRPRYPHSVVACERWIGGCGMVEELIAVVHSIGITLIKIVPVSIALGVAFTLLTFFWACNPGRPWWHKRQLVTD